MVEYVRIEYLWYLVPGARIYIRAWWKKYKFQISSNKADNLEKFKNSKFRRRPILHSPPTAHSSHTAADINSTIGRCCCFYCCAIRTLVLYACIPARTDIMCEIPRALPPVQIAKFLAVAISHVSFAERPAMDAKHCCCAA